MNLEERVLQLEAALEFERAKVRELTETISVALRQRAEAEASIARRQEEEARARTVRRERNRRYRDAQKTAMRRAEDVSETSHTPSPSLPPPSSSPSLSEPISPPPLSSPNPSSPPSASQGNASVSSSPEAFALESPTATRRRKKSAAQEVFEALQEQRKARCVEVGEPIVEEHLAVARQNHAFRALVEGKEDQELFEAAWSLYLADDANRPKEPAWSVAYFMSSGVRAKYETRAAREDAA